MTTPWAKMTEEQKENKRKRCRKLWAKRTELQKEKQREAGRKRWAKKTEDQKKRCKKVCDVWRVKNKEKFATAKRKWRIKNADKQRVSVRKCLAIRQQSKLFNAATQCAAAIAQLANEKD